MATVRLGNVVWFPYQFPHHRRMDPYHGRHVAGAVVLRFHLLVSDFYLLVCDFTMLDIYLCGSFHYLNVQTTPSGKSPVVVAGLLERCVNWWLHVSSRSFVRVDIAILLTNAEICLVGMGVFTVHEHDLHLRRALLRIDQFPRLVCVHSFSLQRVLELPMDRYPGQGNVDHLSDLYLCILYISAKTSICIDYLIL